MWGLNNRKNKKVVRSERDQTFEIDNREKSHITEF